MLNVMANLVKSILTIFPFQIMFRNVITFCLPWDVCITIIFRALWHVFNWQSILNNKEQYFVKCGQRV